MNKPSNSQLDKTRSGNKQDPAKHRYLYPRNKYFNRKILSGEKLDLYLNDFEKNCSPNRKLNGNKKWNNYFQPLLKMCDILPEDKVKGVFGPHMYAEFHGNFQSRDGRQSVEKTITLFGEFHTLEDYEAYGSKIENLDFNGVIPFHSYVKMLLLSHPNKIYDLYTERPFINDKWYKEKMCYLNFSISLIDQQFENCFQLDKSRCEYKNLRAHYTDIRRYNDTKERLNSFFLGVENKLTEVKTKDKLINFWAQIYNIFWSGIVMHFFNSQLVDNDNADVIKEFITKKLEKIVKEEKFYSLRKIEKKIEKNPANVLTDDLKFSITVLLMDIYILARLTKNKNFNTQQNIIIYAGGLHIELYIKFLKYIGFTLGKNYNIKGCKSQDHCPPIVYFDRQFDHREYIFLTRPSWFY